MSRSSAGNWPLPKATFGITLESMTINLTSWKTSLGGFLSGAGLLFASQFPEYAKYGSFAAALGTLLLGFSARDQNVTSEQAGAKPVVSPTPPKV
jgi:hypothetical protein